ncbi:MAG: hypothetical protein ABIP89_05700 [Polyangiaceae bacterium]
MAKSWMVGAALAGLVVVSGSVPRVASAEEDSEVHSSRAQAASAIATMERSSDRVRTLLRRARQSSDERTIACLNEGLSQVDVSVRSARERNQSMAQAYARGDATGARRELAQIAWQKIHVRDVEASSESCLDPRFFHAAEGTTVTVFVDPMIPREASVFSR